MRRTVRPLIRAGLATLARPDSAEDEEITDG
jgi:hypothetical protein